MFKKRIYKWHRTISLIVAIPVILWAASGFMHPIMTTIRPKVATQFLTPNIIDSSKIIIGLDAALVQNKIDSFTNFRVIHIDTNYFYQVQRRNTSPIYLSAKNGKFLPNGDWLYAQYLAKQFLEGPSNTKDEKAYSEAKSIASITSQDCCDAATSAILNNQKGSKATSAVLITDYNDEYKSINRLLPVYKVIFNRSDGIRIYVETTSDRFAFGMDDKRYIFDRIFTIVHTFGWLNFLGKGKFAIEFILAALAFFTTIMGLYIFFTTKSKKVNGNIKIKARRNHRFTSLAIALFTLMFTFSGAYHALSKFKTDTRNNYFVDHNYSPQQLHFNFSQLQSIIKSPISNIAIVTINNTIYWQINTKANNKATNYERKDLMKDKQATIPVTVYVNILDNTILENGDLKYANYLATTFSKNPENNILSTVPITQFTNEYNFTDKRLPVYKVSYANNNNQRFYVETATGRLSKSINDNDLIEGYSFAFFHKHEFMAWGGKSLKDFSTMFWAMAQIAMVTIGLILYFKTRKKISK